MPVLLDRLATLDTLLDRHLEALGPDRTAYGNHCYRMINFCAALAGQDPESIEKMAIAGAFHDIGVWADRTFDYLDPSEKRALAFLEETGRSAWAAEIGAMVQQHHKITPVAAAAGPLPEAFRKADWVDVLHGMVTCGIPRPFLREVFARFPDAGFHLRLVQLSGKRLLTHPWNPMPILRW